MGFPYLFGEAKMRFMIFYLERDKHDTEVCNIARRVIDTSKIDNGNLLDGISKVLMVDKEVDFQVEISNRGAIR